MRRDKELEALNLVALSTEQKAQSAGADQPDRRPRNRRYSRAAHGRRPRKADESAFKLSDTFQGFGQVATSAFEDAIIKGEKFSDVLNGLAEDIQRLLIRNTMNKLVELRHQCRR